MDCESEYDDERTETTQDPGGIPHGLQSAFSLDGMASADGASMFIAPRDIPLGQRVPLFQSPKPRVAPQDQHPSSHADDYPSDPDVQVGWHENKLKQFYKQSIGIEDDLLASRKQLISDAFSVPQLPGASGFE